MNLPIIAVINTTSPAMIIKRYSH